MGEAEAKAKTFRQCNSINPLGGWVVLSSSDIEHLQNKSTVDFRTRPNDAGNVNLVHFHSGIGITEYAIFGKSQWSMTQQGTPRNY